MSLAPKNSEHPIKIAAPFMNDSITEIVESILKSGLLVQGKYVSQFESRLAEYIGCKHVIAINSGTAALHASIQSVRDDLAQKGSLPEGPEVITTPLSFAATANAIIHSGCTPIFADVDEATFNVDPKQIDNKIRKQTIAIEPVDVYGLPADLNEIATLARANDITVVEDAAEAIGAIYNGKKIGSISDLTCFSTYATKNLHTGEGGFITTDDDAHAKRLQMIRSQGQSSRYNHAILGYNFRMTEIAAAIGIPQIGLLDELNSKRRKNARYLRDALGETDTIRFQKVNRPDSHAWYMLSATLDEHRAGMTRDAFVAKLKSFGIEADVSWPVPIHLQPFYRQTFGFKEGDFPMAERICKTVFQIPIQPLLTIGDLDRIITVVIEILRK
ncbi:MAG: DegT/DnrJ/EryC1/StrS family aminotransferase [Nitrososphaerales archaeon]